MSLRDRIPQTLPQEAARGLAISVGVVTVGVWGMLAYGWHLGPSHHLQRLAHGEARPPALTPPSQQAAAPVAQPAVTTPIMADPAGRADEPAPEPVGAGSVKRLPQSHSLLVANAAPAAPAAVDPNGRQVAAEAGLEEAGDMPAGASDLEAGVKPVQEAAAKPAQEAAAKPVREAAAKPMPEAVAKPAPEPVGKPVAGKALTKPVQLEKPRAAARPEAPSAGQPEADVAVEPVFPVAAPVVHARYVSVYSRRLHRRHWVLAAKPTTGVLGREERPAHDLTAAAPVDPAMRVPLVAKAPALQELSPGAQAELAASRREEQMPAAPQQVAVVKPGRRHLAMQRPGLPLSARMAQAPTRIAAGQRPPTSAQHMAAAPAASTQRPVVAHSAPAAVGGARVNGLVMHPVAGATVGEPVYDAASKTLRLPVTGALAEGQLKVYRLDNGRAYVDVTGALPATQRPRLVNTQDGVFRRGAIAPRPEAGGTRLSFDLGHDGDLSAHVEGGQVVLQAVPKKKP